MPDSWKKAVVTPVYKRGPSAEPANYRPISQTSVFCKLMERVIAAELSDYLLTRGLISKHQHGFIAKHSTTTNLLESLNDWTMSIENRLTDVVAYVDFARAFDTVSHEKLQLKLKAYGIQGQLLSPIMNFLRHRSQVTKVCRVVSQPASITSGVVQGSCLGPLLFLIFINDLASIFGDNITPKFYADDLKLYAHLNCSSPSCDFQRSLDQLTDWANIWQLSISIKKCCVMRISSKHVAKDQLADEFVLCGNVLNNVDIVNDLGVLIDKHLTFTEHIGKVVQKATQRCYLIFKSFQSRDKDILLRAFTTYVRPLLEVNSPVWSPHLLRDIRRIESVQRRFTKKLAGLYELRYDERLKLLCLERLEERRIRADLLFTYKVLMGYTSLNVNDFFTLSEMISTRGHPYKLFLPRSQTDCRKYFFSCRIISIWNALPANTDFSNLQTFKRSILSFDLSEYCDF